MIKSVVMRNLSRLISFEIESYARSLRESGRSRKWTALLKGTVLLKVNDSGVYWTIFWRKVDVFLRLSERFFALMSKSKSKSKWFRGEVDSLQYWMVCSESEWSAWWKKDSSRYKSGWLKKVTPTLIWKWP